jgi:hypothetical protein
MEVWKTIQEFENYEVSTFGNVRNVKTLRILSKTVNRDGYLYCCLNKDKKKYTFRIHRLVASAFLLNNFNKPTVNHIDGIKKNNFLSNLEWATRKEQSIHSVENGLHNCRRIKVYCSQNDIVFNSIIEAANFLKINKFTLTAKLNGNRKNNTSLNYA